MPWDVVNTKLLQRIRPHITYSHRLVPVGSVLAMVSTAHRQASDYNEWA